jgi:DNA invertase Pin-like site-specific DNA recombinase
MSETKVGVYVRVSTFDQETGLDSQKADTQRYLDGHSIKDADWYIDRESGSTTDRPAFKRLQKDIFNGHINTVICWKLDRLSRTLRDGINILCDWIKKDVRVVSTSQQLDFSGSVGQLLAAVLFAVGQMERENISENTKRGMAYAKAKGVKLGKRPKLFVKDIMPLIELGYSISDISRIIKKSRPAIYNTFKREGIVFPNSIISVDEDQLELCQQN